jgi:tRNA A37 threonylcarbamoyladenosine dehydratase
VPDDEDDSVFNYIDTAATKAGIVAANCKLEGPKIAIVGTGGTGSYALDFVAKTPVAEIHLFDRDGFLNHNAFRCPGTPSTPATVSILIDGIFDRQRMTS